MLETPLFWLLLAAGALFLMVLLIDRSDERPWERSESPLGKPLV